MPVQFAALRCLRLTINLTPAVASRASGHTSARTSNKKSSILTAGQEYNSCAMHVVCI